MNNSPDSLAESLRSWRVTPPADPGFRHRVWQRIGRQARASWPAYLRAHPAAWSLAAVVALSAAASTGTALARARTQADREAMVVTYLVVLDPRVQSLLKP
jgi:hypothetical protein